MSMQDGVVSDDFKQALINRRIKKQNNENNELKNYRPISDQSVFEVFGKRYSKSSP